jgi:hypothetical protein
LGPYTGHVKISEIKQLLLFAAFGFVGILHVKNNCEATKLTKKVTLSVVIGGKTIEKEKKPAKI